MVGCGEVRTGSCIYVTEFNKVMSVPGECTCERERGWRSRFQGNKPSPIELRRAESHMKKANFAGACDDMVTWMKTLLHF